MSFINQNVHKGFEHKHVSQETLVVGTTEGLAGYTGQIGMVNWNVYVQKCMNLINWTDVTQVCSKVY